MEKMKIVFTYLKNDKGGVVYMPIISTSWEAEAGEFQVRAPLGH